MGPGASLAVGGIVLGALVALVWPEHGLIARVRRNAHFSRRVLTEDVLKHMYTWEARGETTTLAGIAGVLSTSRNRAAALLQTMIADGLVTSGTERIELTDDGREAALHIVRAHRLWERYLSEETGYCEEEWHSRAERREHTLSAAAADDLAAQLGNPTHDPHGDPIPSKDTQAPIVQRGRALPSLEPGTVGEVVHVEDEPEAVYAQLVAEGIHPGLRVRMIDAGPDRVRFWAADDRHTLAPVVARNVTVAPVPEGSDEGGGHEGTGDVGAGDRPDTRTVPPRGTMSLASLETGREATVVEIDPACRGAERGRFLDLGIVPGTRIVPEFRSPAGDPTSYRIRETLIALRERQAEHIRVEPVEEGDRSHA
jgi:DtxR family Mn-dependent transcriptional regulator